MTALASEKSLAQAVAELPDAEREQVLAGLELDDLQYDPQFWLRPTQLRPINELGWQLAAMVAGRGAGKALTLGTVIPTPTGWTTMGALAVGDEVLDETGHPCRVLAVYDHTAPNNGAWRVTFSDGTSIVADGDHLWTTWTHRDRKQYLRNAARDGDDPTRFPLDWPSWRAPGEFTDRWGHTRSVTPTGPATRSTLEIRETFRHSTRGDLNHSIPLTAPLDLPDADLPLDPWLLGFWLGDGSSRSGEIHAGDQDVDWIRERIAMTGETVGADRRHRTAWRINVTGLLPRLRALGVFGDKHIPAAYLRASETQRRALLAGLLDSDGYMGRSVEFCNMNERLARGVLELARTLGERPVLAEGRATIDGRDVGTKYRVTWRAIDNPFTLPRKHTAWVKPAAQALRLRHRMIVSIEPAEVEPMRCITVDSKHSLYLAGEGMVPTHNTRSMCEWTRQKAQGRPTRGALVARTAADVRDVLVAGESGILAVSPPSERPDYEPSKRLLTWPNGTTALCFSSEAPDQLRGPQFNWSVADEIASWKYLPDESGLTAWDNLRLATRLGDEPQIFAGTTPKRTPFMRSLLKAAETESGVLLLRGSTKDNRGNLSQTYIDMIYGLYEGTALAQQELDGVMLDDIDGALWDEQLIEEFRVLGLPKMRRPLVAVGVDPSVSEKPGDETGIVVAVVDAAIRDMYKRHAYILSDASLQAAPEMWARVLVGEVNRFHGAPVIAETNQGGGLIKAVLTGIDPDIRVFGVHSRYGKAIRAEPVVLAYQQGRVHHVGYLPELEDQMTSWVPDESRKSPDRVDACLAAGTLVTTARGDVPIEQVGVDDLIWTPAGWKRTTGARLTATSQQVIRVEASDGSVFLATPDHLVWTANDGWKRTDTLVHGDTLEACHDASWSSGTGDAGRVTQTVLSAANASTTCASTPPGTSLSMSKSGNELVGLIEFPQGMSSTTSTTTQTTIPPLTWSASRDKNTPSFTATGTPSFLATSIWTTWQRFVRWLRLGTAVKKDGRGTPLMENEVGAVEHLSTWHGHVKSAVKSLWRGLTGLDSAPGDVSLGCTDEKSATSPTPSVLSAKKHSNADQEASLRHAAVSVVRLSVEPEVVDVYDVVEVEDIHCFYANGILVHNCVHVLTALLVKQPDGMHSGGVRARSAAGLVIPSAPKPRFRSGALSTVSRRTGGGRVL